MSALFKMGRAIVYPNPTKKLKVRIGEISLVVLESLFIGLQIYIFHTCNNAMYNPHISLRFENLKHIQNEWMTSYSNIETPVEKVVGVSI
jgi:hypothetical protein